MWKKQNKLVKQLNHERKRFRLAKQNFQKPLNHSLEGERNIILEEFLKVESSMKDKRLST